MRLLAEKDETSRELEVYVEPVREETATEMTVVEELEKEKLEKSERPEADSAEQSEAPLKLLHVNVRHWLRQVEVTSRDAIDRTNEPCLLSPFIERSHC